jgi:formylglycine-generating enzyme required for sulfatase activity
MSRQFKLTKFWALPIAVVLMAIIVLVAVYTGARDGGNNRTLSATMTTSPNPPSAVLDRARSFEGGNEAWEAFVWEFNGVAMVLVPAGCFGMGSESGRDDERPVHRVCFEEPFWIDQTEVTIGQFAALGGQAKYGPYRAEQDHPMEQMTWLEAQAFCESRGTHLTTEAEWEYAARGPDSLTYPWGNEFVSDHVVWRPNSGRQTAAIGSKAAGASWVGALDLSGNVSEWVADWYASDYYATLPDGAVNPAGPHTMVFRGMRGGSWYDADPDELRAARRSYWNPAYWASSVGFRCARSAAG